MTKGLALFLVVALAGALADASGSGAVGSGRLKTISSRVHAGGASLVIEATEPVPYLTMRPDPLTVVLDFRNVDAGGLANSVEANAKSPILDVSVEATESMGMPASRVRITLVQPVAHRVRSERNTVVVEFEKLSGKATSYQVPPSSREAPDAMQALAQVERRVADPIAALALASPSASLGTGPSVPAPLVRLSAAAGSSVQAQQPVTPPAQQPPATPSPADQVGGAVRERKYTGNPVSLDFQGADLRAVLRTFSEISALNMVIDPAVQGSVDVALRDVPWDQALDLILRSNKLGYAIDGTIVRIVPLTVLAEEEKQRSDLAKAQADGAQLSTLTRQLSYAKAEELQALLTKSVLSQRGAVQVETRTNTLIITDLPDRLTSAGDLIATLDKAQPQVEIEARIVQANRNYARELGVQWGFNGRVDPALGNTTPLAFPNSGSISGSTTSTQTTVEPVPGVPITVPGKTAVGLALGAVNGAFNLDVALTAAESSGNVRVLSTPRVSTQNNGEAEITQGVQIPIQTVANNTVTVSFKDAALTLKVTPQITAAGTVIMKIALENAQADFSRAINGIPPINTQRANTVVLVNDGQTTVIGGIYTSLESAVNERTPGLNRLPLLGWLFKRDRLEDESRELLIFITPRIIKG